MNDPVLPGSFFVSVLTTLEELGVPYFVVGGFAAIAFGVSRVTFDVDIVVKLEEEKILLLANRYPLPRYYADPEQMRSSVAMGVPFNIIDSSTAEKADLIPAAHRHTESFKRRVRKDFVLTEALSLEVWCASREDVILGKLRAWSEVTSRKHERDILELVMVARAEANPLDLGYIDSELRELGGDAHQLWQTILNAAGGAS